MSYCKPFRRGVSWRSQNFAANATIYGPHSGNDDAAPIGTPVHAAGDGVIEWAGEFDDTYQDNLLWLLRMGGNIAVLNCGDNAPSFVYGHLDRFTVRRGDRVRKGQVIAYSGNTGTATTGAHLHTEAIPPGYVLNSPLLGRVNPDIYLTEWPEDLNAGSLSYMSESIEVQEDDDMANVPQEDWEILKQQVSSLVNNVATKKDLGELPQTFVTHPFPYKDPKTGNDTGQTTNVATVLGFADFQAVATRALLEQRPADVAAQLNAAGIAESVRDELVKLIGGK
jgi:hypothetical protein